MTKIQALVLSSALCALAGAARADVVVNENRQSGTLDCQGAAATVNSNHNEITFRGCSRVTINGNWNTIAAGSPDMLQVLGNDNHVTWAVDASGRRPRVSNLGSRNTVSAAQGEAPARAGSPRYGEGDTDQLLIDLGAVQKADRIELNLGGDILFDFDSTAIKPGAAEQLAKAAHVIRQRSVGEVYVVGHTDARGSADHNQKLSQARADAVISWLGQNGDIPAARLVGYGMGSKKPVAHNTRPDGSDDPEGRARNRRVEIVLATRPGIDLRADALGVRVDESGVDVGQGAVKVDEQGVRAGGVVVSPGAGTVAVPRTAAGAKGVRGAVTCSAGQTCKYDCPEGECTMACAAGAVCDFSCSGGNCQMSCAAGANCDLGCAGGNCRQVCAMASRCRTRCEGGDCSS